MNLMRLVFKVIIFSFVFVGGGGGVFEFDLNWVLMFNGYCLKYFYNIFCFNYVEKKIFVYCVYII